MSRQIVLDTETTGLSAENGDRIIELGCVELFNRKLTGNDLHIYFNPERESHEDALKVHGLTTDFLRDKPKFATLANDIVEYLRDAELIIHNAAFDVGFLNKEFERAGLPTAPEKPRRSLSPFCKRKPGNSRTMSSAVEGWLAEKYPAG